MRSRPPFKRAARINELLQESISLALLTEVKDPRVEGVTVTRVRVSDDLHMARVYFRLLQPKKELNQQATDELQKALAKVAVYMRGSLGKRLHLKRIPELCFELDKSLDHHSQVSELLQQIADERPAKEDVGEDHAG